MLGLVHICSHRKAPHLLLFVRLQKFPPCGLLLQTSPTTQTRPLRLFVYIIKLFPYQERYHINAKRDDPVVTNTKYRMSVFLKITISIITPFEKGLVESSICRHIILHKIPLNSPVLLEF